MKDYSPWIDVEFCQLQSIQSLDFQRTWLPAMAQWHRSQTWGHCPGWCQRHPCCPGPALLTSSLQHCGWKNLASIFISDFFIVNKIFRRTITWCILKFHLEFQKFFWKLDTLFLDRYCRWGSENQNSKLFRLFYSTYLGSVLD